MAVSSSLPRLGCFGYIEKPLFIFPLALFLALVFNLFSNIGIPVNASAQEKPTLLPIAALDLTKKEKDWLNQNHTIRARVGNAPPLHFFKGTSVGISVDYLNLVARKTGIRIEYIHDIPWTDALENIKKHQNIDVILTAKNTEERRKYILFTDDYLFMSRVIFTQSKNEFVGSIDDLFSKIISVEKDYVIHKKLASEYPNIKLLLKENSIEALQAVATGEADAYIGNLTIATYILQKYHLTNLKIACPAPFENHNQAFAIRNDWPELVSIINKVLHVLTAEEHAQIRNNWLSLKYEYGINKTDILKWVLSGFGFFGLFLGFFVFWNRRLKFEITEREQTEKSLRENQRRIATLMGNLPGMVYRCHNTRDWPMIFVSEGAVQLTGYYPTDYTTDSPFKYGELIHPDDQEMVWGCVQSSIDKQQPFTFTYRITDKQNQKKWVWEQGQGVFNEQGELTFIEGFITDITELKKAETQLQESEERYRTLFDYNPVDTIVVNTEAKIVTYNRVKKLSQREVPLVGTVMYRDYAGKHQINMFENLMESMRSGEPKEFLDLKYKERFLYIRIAPFSDGAIITSIDTTPLKKLENQLQQSQRMEAIGTLAGGIAHDFNNILSAIIGYSGLAKDSIPYDNSAQQDIDTVIESSRRAADLVQQILTFSRKGTHQLQALAPHLVIKETLKMLRSSLPTTLSLVEEIDLECGFILADSTNFHQIVMNLCMNAYHAMENEKGTLAVSLYRKEIVAENVKEVDISSGPFIVLSVSDTGHGMSKETIDRIYEPYFTTKEVGKGTGLGLAVIHGIVKDYNGFIEVESEPEKGSTFVVYLPAIEEVASTQERPHKQKVATGNERILVIDDESIIVNLQQTILERLGYTVTATTNSKEALEKIHLSPDQFDLIISDQTMPHLTGAELAKEVLKIKPGMPFILCTGYSSIITEKETRAIGIKKYIRKPVGNRALANIVRQVLDGE